MRAAILRAPSGVCLLVPLLAALPALLSPASAATLALDPQVRVHAGASVIPAPSGVGITGGFESRLTRLVAIDISAFASPIPLEDDVAIDGAEDFGDYQLLRHGIHASLGLRIPHAQPKTWAWDIFLRPGGGLIWVADASPGDESDTFDVRSDMGAFGGADLMVRFGIVGVRASARAWMYDAHQTFPTERFFLVRPQFGLEGLVQW